MIAQVHHQVGRVHTQVRENRFESEQVSVDVRQHRDSHERSFREQVRVEPL